MKLIKKKRFAVTSLTLLLGVIVCLTIYETSPKQIKLRSVTIPIGSLEISGIAKDLIIQEFTNEGIWATRGYNIYFKQNDENTFRRIGKVPIPMGIPIILKFRVIRQILNKQEVLELKISESESIIAFGGGWIFQSTDNGQVFKLVSQLKHYGFGKGRGVMPQGYTADANGNLFWGEYWRNPDRLNVQLLMSNDGGINWESSFEFSDGEIRHIHAVQYDPFFDALWIATGDLDQECHIMYSTDGGSNFHNIGFGSQKWRACSLIFSERSVYWGMDGHSDMYPRPLIWKWDRLTQETEEVGVLDSFGFYSTSLSNGTLVLTTDGTNGSASLWLSKDGDDWQQTVSWDQKRKNHFGNIRVASRDNSLVITNINLSHFNNDLLILSNYRP